MSEIFCGGLFLAVKGWVLECCHSNVTASSVERPPQGRNPKAETERGTLEVQSKIRANLRFLATSIPLLLLSAFDVELLFPLLDPSHTRAGRPSGRTSAAGA